MSFLSIKYYVSSIMGILVLILFLLTFHTTALAAENLTPEEVAIKKINTAANPEEIIQDQPKKAEGFWIGWPNPLDALNSIKDRFALFTARSDDISQAELPEEFQSTNQNLIQRVLGLLSGKTSVYGAGVYDISDKAGLSAKGLQIGPVAIPGTEAVNDQEKLFENAYYPTEAGIRPITGSN